MAAGPRGKGRSPDTRKHAEEQRRKERMQLAERLGPKSDSDWQIRWRKSVKGFYKINKIQWNLLTKCQGTGPIGAFIYRGFVMSKTSL